MSNPTSIGTEPIHGVAAAADRLVICTENSSNWKLFYTTDGTSLTAATTPKVGFGGANTLDVASDGTDFLAVAGNSYCCLFTWSSKTWGSQVTIYLPVTPTGLFFPKIARRSSDYVVMHEDDSEKVMGTSYGRLAVSYGAPGGWTKVSSGINAGSANSTVGFGILSTAEGRCHVHAQVFDIGGRETRQFLSNNTWAGTADSNGNVGSDSNIYNGNWATVVVSSPTEYFVAWTYDTTANTCTQAKSVASPTWEINRQIFTSDSGFVALAARAGVMRGFRVQAVAAELQYAESTDGGNGFGSLVTFATTGDLGHTPSDTKGTRAASWTVGSADAWSVVYLGPSNTYYHYYKSSGGARRQPPVNVSQAVRRAASY